jgi:hypothetical protein
MAALLLSMASATMRPVVVGLTGGIGMGKSSAATWFKRCGFRVHGALARQHWPCLPLMLCSPIDPEAPSARNLPQLHQSRRRPRCAQPSPTRAPTDADGCVHRLYSPGGAAVAPVAEAFPTSLAADGGIDRAALSAAVVAKGREEALRTLEHIVHPLVTSARAEFVRQAQEVRAKASG